MANRVLFYVSGHGFGHARRMTQVIAALRRRLPDIDVTIRSAAPARIFEPLPPASVAHTQIDAGLVERDPLTIDAARSLEQLLAFMAASEQIVEQEIRAVREIDPACIVADIPFLAGDVAQAAGIPCIGISNFTWDWIYGELFAEDPRFVPIGRRIEASYARFTALLELPFGKTCPAIGRKVNTPLVVIRSVRQVAEIARQIGLSPDEHRPRVLFGTRGLLDARALAAATTESPDFLFLCPHALAEPAPANVLVAPISSALDFSDLLRVSDVVISKLGYGMISECIASGVRLIWPPREGFAEDQVVAADAPRFARMTPISRDDYFAGRWREALHRAMQLPPAPQFLRPDGAEACADFLCRIVLEK